MTFRKALPALLYGVAAIATPASAQTAETPAPPAVEDGEDEEGEPIVVVGALTDVAIDREEIELTQANDLADLFRHVPSVTVGGGVGLAQKIYVRGIEDSLLNVTIDGAPQRGTLFHHIGRVSIEPELLESVEVQAGAGEATSGFGAIGGAIRFRTRDPVTLLQPGRDIGAIGRAGWFSNDGYKLSGTVFARLFGDVGILGSFVHVDRDDYEDGNGVVQRGTGARQQLGFIRFGGDLGGGHRLALSYEHRDEEGAFGQRPNWPVLTGDTLFPVEGKRQSVTANYRFNVSPALGLEATGYWTRSEFTQDRFDRWGLYGAEIESYGFDLRARVRRAGHDVTFGVEHRNDRVMSEYLGAPAMWQPWAWDPAIGRFVEEGSLLGLYVQDRWQALDSLLLSFGARYDSYDMTQVTYADGAESDGFSFNAGATFTIAPGLSLNAGYAEAFRGKEIGDAFTLEHRPGRLSLSPTLRPERVENIEGGIAYDRDGIRASAVYYRMKIRDVVLDQLYAGPPPQSATYYENVGDFVAEGFELRAGYRRGPFSIDGYFNHYDSRLNGRRIEGYEHLALGNSVGDNMALILGYEPTPSLGFRATLTRYEDLNDLEVLYRDVELGYVPTTEFIDKPGYTVVDLFARWQPFRSHLFELQAAVYNLFDTQYRAHASVGDYRAIPDYEIVAGLPEPGRNVRLTASLRF
ncbi:MAG TPA: TonB-dependent receptor [Allosphingosinicella sp.]|nr:TonB-dependent receptor [Allosphingosinicella sp.]